MEIYQVIFAENIQPFPPVATNILPGYLQLPYTPEPTKPILYSFAMAIIITGEDNESLNHPITVEIFDPNGNSVGKGAASSQQKANPASKNTDGYVSAFVNLDLRNFPFGAPGEYRFLISVGDLTHEAILRVTVAESNG